ncbi:hypothetical protein [Sulfuriferula multivorans]|uniref:hypothetical protein n=1 Tax=Sulfuriferula multivorans TaxID=1559896 RepID=UPI000F5BC630|nr:hypothetical protein [Sulfuriferula multivorans]
MSKLKVTLVVLFVALGVSASSVSMADRGHWRGHVGVGINLGPMWAYPGYYPYYPGPYYYPAPPYYYPPPVVTAPASPPVYIEQGDGQDTDAPSQQSNFWYYCANPQGYYPYVKQCSGRWQAVAPQPSSPVDGR